MKVGWLHFFLSYLCRDTNLPDMKHSVFSNILFIIILFILLTGCKKNKESVQQPQPIFTVELTDNFIKKGFSGFIFISDKNGNCLGDTICRANGTYPVYNKSGLPVPSQLSVTVGYSDINMHTLVVNSTTFTAVPPSGEWTIRGDKPDTAGHATVTLQNLPVTTGPVIFSNSGYNNSTFITTDVSQMMYVSPDDLYVFFKAQGVGKYKKLGGITVSGNYSVDVSDALPIEDMILTFPFSVQDYDVSVAGYKGNDIESRIPVLIDRVISDGTGGQSTKIAATLADFSGFITDMRIRETFASDVQYFNHSDGAVPDRFYTIGASISSVSASSGHAVLSASGIFTMPLIVWQYNDGHDHLYNWTVCGPDSARVLNLPAVPAAVSNVYPTLVPDSMIYQSAELRSYPALTGYSDLMDLMHNPSRTVKASDYQMQSVQKLSGNLRQLHSVQRMP
jgi:hypothetical protein